MEDAQDQTSGCTELQRPAQMTVRPSTKVKHKQKLAATYKPSQRSRVNIGFALTRWRALKAEYGMRSDAEVALRLMDLSRNIKTLAPQSPPYGSSDKKIKFSQSEVQTLIEQEVDRTLKMNEAKLRHLLKSVEQLDQEVNYKGSIQKLETRVNIITQRAEAALVYMAKKKKKSPLPSVINVDIIRSDSEDETMETESQNHKRKECEDNSGEIFQTMETTKKALKKMQADNKALTAAIEDVSEELTPPVSTPCGSPESKEKPESLEEEEEHVEVAGQSQAEMVKKETLSPRDNNSPKPTYLKPPKGKPLYPALPPITFPTVLSMEAASYNIPRRPEVRLALIRKPAGLSVLWNVPGEDPFAPPMESYGIFMTTENGKGSGVFSKWTKLGEVAAIPLPICVMISKYKPGRKVCVAVVGKDKFGRYGPYSEVVTAAIPE